MNESTKECYVVFVQCETYMGVNVVYLRKEEADKNAEELRKMHPKLEVYVLPRELK